MRGAGDDDDDDRDEDDGSDDEAVDSVTDYEEGVADILDDVMNQDGD